MPSLLFQNPGILQHHRVENGIQINMHQIEIILLIHARHRIGREVGTGHRVQKGVQRSFQKHVKGALHRKMLRSVKHRMFQNMGRAKIVFRNGFECDVKKLVGISGGDFQQVRPAFFMHKVKAFCIDLLYKTLLYQFESLVDFIHLILPLTAAGCDNRRQCDQQNGWKILLHIRCFMVFSLGGENYNNYCYPAGIFPHLRNRSFPGWL